MGPDQGSDRPSGRLVEPGDHQPVDEGERRGAPRQVRVVAVRVEVPESDAPRDLCHEVRHLGLVVDLLQPAGGDVDHEAVRVDGGAQPRLDHLLDERAVVVLPVVERHTRLDLAVVVSA